MTAQQLFKRMMRELITPALRELGMQPWRGGFRYTSGDYTGFLGMEKSRRGTKDDV